MPASTSEMNENIITALFAAASALFGGIVSGVVAPFVKHRLDQAVAEKSRKRDQIAKWRKMVLEVNQVTEGDMCTNESLQIHPEYITLEPYLTDNARRTVQSEDIVLVVGQVLPFPLETLKNEISRIEQEWGLKDGA